MTERPIFIPLPESSRLVDEIFVKLRWNSNSTYAEKKANIYALHEAAKNVGYQDILEVSTKSGNRRGRHLSAFHVKVQTSSDRLIPLECAFQGSKVFESGGPFTDLFLSQPVNAKKDPRLRRSGRLIAFRFEGIEWPLEPKTAFYDWLYVTSIYPYREWAVKLNSYGGFSDIEFDPSRSINCQARSIALFLSLLRQGRLDLAVKSPTDFMSILHGSEYRPQLRMEQKSPTLLSA